MTTKPYPSRIDLRRNAALGLAGLIALFALPVLAQAPAGIPGIVAPGVEAELVQEGFTFTEGPVGTADGGLYFADIRVNRVFHLDAAGKISVFRENTNGTNGIALT
jgi:gluconolactonase